METASIILRIFSAFPETHLPYLCIYSTLLSSASGAWRTLLASAVAEAGSVDQLRVEITSRKPSDTNPKRQRGDSLPIADTPRLRFGLVWSHRVVIAVPYLEGWGIQGSTFWLATFLQRASR